LAASVSQDIGARIENIVFLHLKRKTDQMFYYVTQKGNEVDFAPSSLSKSQAALPANGKQEP